MFPVRWKYLIVTLGICLVQCVTVTLTDAQQMQDAISMTADGWRPIVGTRRQPAFIDEIAHYRNQNVNKENVKKTETSATPLTTQTTPSSSQKSPTKSGSNNNAGAYKKYNSKVPPHTKLTSPGHVYYSGSHGPHIPLGGMPANRPGPTGPVKKYPPTKFTYMQGNNKRGKPVRGQTTAHSNREEVYAPAPNPGSYSFISTGQNAVKTRDPPGILLGSNHFPINQQNSHIEFNNRFQLPQVQNENLYQPFNSNPVPSYIFPKHQQQNDVHYAYKNQNDEYTRNLVPPPQPYKNFQEKDLIKNKNSKLKEGSGVTQSSNQNTQYLKNSVPQNIALQLPPPFEQNKFNYAQNEVKNNNQATEVEVTKQKLKVFHNNIPSNYNPLSLDYVDYDFHTVKRPTNIPKLQTYEVTEGKQWQETPPFHYRFPEPQHITSRTKKPAVSRRPPPEPPIIELSQPILELSLPPFLPTPFKPEGVVPTSPTQEEVSTIFTQISNKVKSHEYQTSNPQFFDVKEVSTHYPILGKPEIKPELQTEPNLRQEQELTNEITTNNADDGTEKEQTTTLRTTTRDPQRVRGSHRRRRPSNRLRITTTEEPVQTESYDLQKMQENETESPFETERPLRRRPIRYRTTTTTEASEIEEPTTRTTRGRNRYRQRQNNNEYLKVTNARKRLRPTDMPSNHKMTQVDLDANDYKQTTEELSDEQYTSSTEETQGLADSTYSKESDATDEDIHVKSNRYEYDLNGRRYPAQLEHSKHPTISTNNDETSDKDDEVEVMGKPTTEIIPTTNIHMPENEIDYSTPETSHHEIAVTEQQPEIEEITIATTIPSTTTTEEITTTKSHRIRGRPVKYDASNRPRFSVKDYKQRFSTTTTTTESYKTTSNPRIRFPNRSRRPIVSSTTVNSLINDEEQVTDTMRIKFKPKDPRHSATTEANENIITEKTVKAVNTRLRPFGRQRSTTESTTVKVSIKPNLFSQRRRPPPLSLRNRIYNKLNKTQESTTTESESENETEPIGQTTVPYEVSTLDVTTEYPIKKVNKVTELTNEEVESTTTDFLKNDPLLYSQRVSDLTSSFKNEYNTPGLFKNVSPTSRRIPSYFTISTDDPILPIEAFFPNIKDNNKE